jgi:hypothetical protein
MKQLFILLLLAATGHCFGQGGKTKNDLTIVIIRHGEKYAAGSNLNCKGLNRALHIPAVINKQFGRPLLIYVPTIKTGAVTSQDRMLQTATPLAVTDSVAINSQFDETNTSGLAGYLKTQNGLQLVVWEHTNIPKLGQALGLGKDSLSWKGSDFDTIWIVTFPNGRKHAPKLVKTTEGLNGLPNQCPTGQVLSRLTEAVEKAKSTELIDPAFNKHPDLLNQGS